MLSRLILLVIRGLPWFLIFAGAACLANGVLDFVRAVSSSEWPTAEGTIVSSDIASETRRINDPDVPLRNRKSSTSYWPKLAYEYTVNGKTYSGGQISFTSARSGPHVGTGQAEAQEIVDRYPVGSQVKVFYNPEEPEIAALESGATASNFATPAIGVFFILAGLGLRRMFGPRMSSAESDAIQRLEDLWAGKERSCPKCGKEFTSVQNKGICPECHFAFYASHPDNTDDYPS